EQIVEVQEMVDETIRDRSLYDPQSLKYFFKILTDVSQDNNPDGDDEGEDNISQQPRPTVTEVFDAYYDKSTEEPLESIAFGSKEEERETELEVLLQKLVAECEAATKKEAEEKNNDLPDEHIKVARIGGAEETYLVGPYCEEVGVKEVKEKNEIEVEKEEAGVEKNEEKEVEIKREEKEETKEEKRKKYEENVPARIGKIVGETEDEDDDNEADKNEEVNDDDDETIVDEEDDAKKEDIKELTKKSKDLDYGCKSWIKKVEGFRTNEKWKKKVRVFLGKNKGDFDENKREEFIPPRVPMFDTAPGQVVKERVTKKMKVMKQRSQESNHRSRSKGRKRDKKSAKMQGKESKNSQIGNIHSYIPKIVRSLIMLDEIVNDITWSKPIEITPMPPLYNDSHDLVNRVSLTSATPAQKRLLHEMVTPYYYTVALKVYDVFVVVRIDQIYRTTRVTYHLVYFYYLGIIFAAATPAQKRLLCEMVTPTITLSLLRFMMSS
ncbi:13587_t:CDS:2, partial [Racocetra persica]